MKGYLILSGPRSGTSWIGSLVNSTGVMGYSGEWLGLRYLEKPVKEYSLEEHFDFVLQQGTTSNNRFGIKIFPRYLNEVYGSYEYDFIQKCMLRHDVKLLRLKREDRLGQAISHVRASQTQQWRNYMQQKGQEKYDYLAIRSAMAYTDYVEKYWETYLHTHKLDFETYVYEDLVLDPLPWVNSLVEHLDVEVPKDWDTSMKIQRDDKTQVWRERFLEDYEKDNRGELKIKKPGWFQRLADRLPN